MERLLLGRPDMPWCEGARLRLPTHRSGTLVVWRVDRLRAADQQRLLEWLERRGATRVVAVSPHSIFQLVEQGTFPAELYYRLNTLLIHAGMKSMRY